jgi:hypothetical protein
MNPRNISNGSAWIVVPTASAAAQVGPLRCANEPTCVSSKSTAAGTRWWPDGEFEREHIHPEQEARFEADAWEESIGEYLATHSQVTVGQVAREALHIETARIGTAEQRRVAAALERLGWVRQGKDWKGNRWWTRE